MEDMEIPMTASLPVNVSNVSLATEGIHEESFLQDASVSEVEEFKDPDVVEDVLETEEQKVIADSLESEFEQNDIKEEISLAEQVSLLENEVLGLKEINSQLAERVSNIEMKNKISAETLLQLALMLQKLAKEEEGKDEKTGMLEVLINFLVLFMKEMFVPEDENNKTRLKEKVEPKKQSKIPSERISQILELLKKESAPKAFQTPHIEMMAA
jgi:hypothetical protein